MSNYAIYPFKNMRITQTYNGGVSHKPHNTGEPKDYPIDEGGKDTGKEACYCPCDEIIIQRVYGVGSRGVNTIFWESTTPCKLADGTTDYLCGMFTHTIDSDLKGIKAGSKFKRGQVVCKEGTDGGVGMHLHMSFGKGKLTGNGWTCNTKGKYVLTCTHGTFKPEQLLYVDNTFTAIKSTNGLKFKTKPIEKTIPSVSNKYTVGVYKVTTNLLYVRSGAGTKYSKKKFKDLTANAQKQIKELNKGKEAAGLVKDCMATVIKVDGNWGQIPSGWICLDYCKKVG